VVGVLREVQGGWEAPFAFLLAGLVLQVLAGVAIARAGTLEDQLHRRRSRRAPDPSPPAREEPAPVGDRCR
jgi:CP family cyanate transporter-like MFS transporter